MTRVPDSALQEVRDQGFSVVEGFLSDEDLASAQDALWSHFPRPDEYFADPAAHPRFDVSAFAGIDLFPYRLWALSRLALHPDLIDAARRYCGSSDVEMYKSELWAKYSGATDYEQPHHRDFGNHSLVVPRADGRWSQLTTFLLLSDVGPADAPTALVAAAQGDQWPLIPRRLEPGQAVDDEVLATGPAGTLLLYRTDVLHRATAFGEPGRVRFTVLTDYQQRGNPWQGKISWPNRANDPGMAEVMVNASPDQREVIGFPPAGHEYWCAQTLTDVAARYPGIDLTPYDPGLQPS